MLPIARSPICGIKVAEKQVTETVQSGRNTASLKINAKVCVSCRKQLYHVEIVNKFE